MKWSKLAPIGLMGVFLLMGMLVSSSMAQSIRDPFLADTKQPGSVIVFPKFVRGTVQPPGEPTVLPRTEFEIGVVCPEALVLTGGCLEFARVKIRFHYVCGTDQNPLTSFICKESDFEAIVTVNGKLVFNVDGIPPGNFNAPQAPCDRGYLIGWVEDNFRNPVKFDGLIGDAVLRESDTAVSAYSAVTIQADPLMTTCTPSTSTSATCQVTSQILLDPASGGLPFTGIPGTRSYMTVASVIYTDVAYNRGGSATLPARDTFLTLLTLDVFSGRPNPPTFVDFRFYNVFENLASDTAEFICWAETNLTTINTGLTAANMGSRKGLVIGGPAEQPIIFPVPLPFFVPVTLIGLVDTTESRLGLAPSLTPERSYAYNVFNNNVAVPTLFLP
jgi:hypothetical protein